MPKRNIGYSEIVALQIGFEKYRRELGLASASEEHREALEDYIGKFESTDKKEYPTPQDFIDNYRWEGLGLRLSTPPASCKCIYK